MSDDLKRELAEVGAKQDAQIAALRVEFEEWLDGWSPDLLPRVRDGWSPDPLPRVRNQANGAYASQYTELAWLAYKAGASRVSSAQRAALLALAESNALRR